MLSSIVLLVLAPSFLLQSSVAPAPPQQAGPAARPTNRPPVIQCSITESEVCFGTIQFTVTATDPEGDPVTLRSLKRQRGLTFPDIQAHPSPATAHVTWNFEEQGPVVAAFVAHDSQQPQIITRFNLRLYVADCAETSMVEVTGDGQPDLIGWGEHQNVGPFQGAGEIYIWPGGSTSMGTPAITLNSPGLGTDDELEVESRSIDFTGDGLPDIVGVARKSDVSGFPDGGAVFVWQGGLGLSSSSTPVATLVRPGADLWFNDSPSTYFQDVTGDGTADIIVHDEFAQPGPANGEGVYYIFKGGPTMTGTIAPIAMLANPSPNLGARMTGLEFQDMTGDGLPDLVTTNVSSTFIFESGPNLVGTPAPRATLSPPQINFSGSQRYIVDVTGDGYPEVFLGRSKLTHGGVLNSGAVYFWAGGPALVGTLSPTATLFDPHAQPEDRMSPYALDFQDVTGDGVLDVVTASSRATIEGVSYSGAIYVWDGTTAFSGETACDFKLTFPSPEVGQSLKTNPQFGDVTGDGVLDIVSFSTTTDGNGMLGVWEGGPSLLQGQACLPLSTVGLDAGGNPSLLLVVEDWDDDGVGDILTRNGGFGNNVVKSTIHYGRRNLQADAAPDAALVVPGATSSDGYFAQTYRVDVTGDSKPELIEVWRSDSNAGVNSQGATYMWVGGRPLGTTAPSITLRDPAGQPLDYMGGAQNLKPGSIFRDMDGDGLLDVLLASTRADGPGVVDAGNALLWTQLNIASGTPAPKAVLQDPNALPGDFLGFNLRICDWDGDGLLDIIAGSYAVDAFGVSDAGAMHYFRGSSLTGSVGPDTTLAIPWASAGAWMSL